MLYQHLRPHDLSSNLGHNHLPLLSVALVSSGVSRFTPRAHGALLISLSFLAHLLLIRLNLVPVLRIHQTVGGAMLSRGP